MTRLAFFFDSSACSGCKACQMACKDKNDLPIGQVWRRVYEVSGGGWEQHGDCWNQNVFAYNLSISCNHCEDPICAKNCPTRAIQKREDGIVLIDQGACIGCKYCSWACPYGALQFNPDKGVMGKCDLCADYVDQGKNPSCVDACPMRALDFGDFDELLEKHGQQLGQQHGQQRGQRHGQQRSQKIDQDNGQPGHVHPLPDPAITQPSIVIRPHQTEGRPGATVSNLEEVKSA